MKIARVVGALVATARDERLQGLKLLLLREVNASGQPTGVPFAAVDTVGAGPNDVALVVTGDAVRLADRLADAPVDAAIIAILEWPTPQLREN